jgi:hypothetical protein
MVLLVALAIALAAWSSQTADDFVWHAYPGEQVQYGVEGTDFRAVGFGCEDDGRLWLSTAADPDLPAVLTLQGAAYEAEFAERGDGPNLVVILSPDSAPVRAVLENRALELGQGPHGWTVPGGGGALLRSLIEHCEASE